MVQAQRDLECSSDIRKFTELSKVYAQMPIDSRKEENGITKELLEISNRQLNSEKFSKAIQDNDLTKSAHKSITQEKIEENKIFEISRGIER